VFDDHVVITGVVLGGGLQATLGDELVDEAHVVAASFFELASDALKGSAATWVPAS
jgi:hypothetical protein